MKSVCSRWNGEGGDVSLASLAGCVWLLEGEVLFVGGSFTFTVFCRVC